ncbi:hypothetical protein RM844_15370 [Streptomyces sp. DSM 44915]|uniref:Uncharacterized protein n=1 Tax=Streptomyces chisholmiae TaxID=3075540 RepID=A0ABU2JSF0_9ACTN|nr:hypothetical protein [Streptomyces sp. DSM 44915]MDT0267666.1 hypothetical protein [Streptomyces sp. DSM 44915]
MSKLKTRVAAAAAGLAVLAGVSVATAGSATAAPRGGQVGQLLAPWVSSTSSEVIQVRDWQPQLPAFPKFYSTLRECQTVGNTLAQQGRLIGFECAPVMGGGYFLRTW